MAGGQVEQGAQQARAATWRVALLGGLRLDNGETVHTRLSSRAVTALLARLALQPRRAHAREELVALLWPEADLSTGRNRLRQALSALRAVLEPPGAVPRPVLLADRVSVRVVPEALWCDAVVFEALARAGQAGPACALYAGELLPGFYDEWIEDERARLQALRDRLDDGPAGETALPPGHPAAAPDRLALPADLLEGSVPHYVTRVYGAEAHRAALQQAVCTQRLVTLVGPGGAGKTRLAVELAHALRPPAAPGGFDLVVFVPLAACRDRESMLQALHEALRLATPHEGRVDALVRHLLGRRMLLVLDNCEQLEPEAAALPSALVARLAGLHLLCTSRRSLALDGETLVDMPALPLPDPLADLAAMAANPAVALFVDRARAARADFHLHGGNAAAIAELVGLLHGLPLAIELAACRVRSLSPAQMLALLRPVDVEPDAAATPGLDLLARAGPRSGGDPRHASMQRVIEWSWHQLEPAQRQLLGELTVFRGGADIEAVQAVSGLGAGAVLALDALVSQSMVQILRRPEREPEAARFDLIQPVREFARARLDSPVRAALRRRHRAHLCAWCEALPTTPALERVREEMPNLRAALRSAELDLRENGDVAGAREALRILLGVGPVWADTGELPYELLGVLARLVPACPDAGPRVRAEALLSRLYLQSSDRAAALRHAQRALEQAPPSGLLRALALHAWVRQQRMADVPLQEVEARLDEVQQALDAATEAERRELPRLVQDTQARILATRAILARQLHRRPAQALALHREALAVWRSLGDGHAVEAAYQSAGTAAFHLGERDVALAAFQAVADTARTQRHWLRLSQAHNGFGEVHTHGRDWAAAAAAYADSLDIAWRAVARRGVLVALWNLPRPLLHLGRVEAAMRLAAFNEHFQRLSYGSLQAQDRLDVRRWRRLAARQATPAQRAQAQIEGAALSLPAAVSLALGAARALPQGVDAPLPRA